MLRILFSHEIHERRLRNIRIIEPFPFFLSKQPTEFGEADGYGL